MRNSITAVLIAIFGFIGVAQASDTTTRTAQCAEAQSNFNYASNAAAEAMVIDFNIDAFRRASDVSKACGELFISSCGPCNGFECPPPRADVVEKCRVDLDEPPTSEVIAAQPKKFHSEKLRGGVHHLSFDFPMDVFDVDQVNITFSLQSDPGEITVPSLSGKNNALYITNDYMEDGRFTCKSRGFESLDGTIIKPSQIWDGRHQGVKGYGARRSDWIFLKNIAHCQAWGNQAFTVTIAPVPVIVQPMATNAD